MANNYGSDDADQGHRNWLSDMAEAKHLCRELLFATERSFTNPQQCLSVGLGPQAADLLKKQHAATLNYYDELVPFAGQIHGTHWTDELCQVEVPADENQVTFDERIPHNKSLNDLVGPEQFYRTGRQRETVTLKDLGDWEMRASTIHITALKQFEGRVSRSLTRRVWLPPMAARRAFRKLNTCVENLGFAAEVKELEVDLDPYRPHQNAEADS